MELSTFGEALTELQVCTEVRIPLSTSIYNLMMMINNLFNSSINVNTETEA